MADSMRNPSDPRGPDDPAWSLPQVEPSSWVAFVPGSECPTREEVMRDIASWVGGSLDIAEAENQSPMPELVWSAAVRIPEVDSMLVVWAERSSPLPEAAKSPEEAAITECPWVIRVQALLGDDDPAADHFAITSLLAGALPFAPALLDINSGALLGRDALERWYLSEHARPSEQFLWSVQALGFRLASSSSQPKRRSLVFTMGLSRCHRPELAILDLPHQHLDAAKALIDGVASLLLEHPVPAPGVPFPIGPDLSVSFQRWNEVAKYIEAGAPGSPASIESIRKAGGPSFEAVHAVICEPVPVGAYRRIWSWPTTAIHRLESGRGVMFRSRRSTEAAAARVRRSWHDFATAWASLHQSDSPALRELASRGFRVLATMDSAEAAAGGSGARPAEGKTELGWFEVEGFEAGAVRAKLTISPLSRADLHEGMRVRIPSALVRDWRVSIGGRDFGPDEPAELLREVDRLRGIA